MRTQHINIHAHSPPHHICPRLWKPKHNEAAAVSHAIYNTIVTSPSLKHPFSPHQDYGAPRDDPDIAALAESLAREERAWCRNSAGQSATQQRRDLEARFGPRVERLRELLKRQTQEQIGSSIHTVPAASYCLVREKLASRLS